MDWNHPCTYSDCTQHSMQGGNLASEENIKGGSNAQLPHMLPMDMDASELERLFASCIPKLARTTRWLARDVQDSEDVLQEGLLSAFLHLRQFEGRSKFSTWLYSIVRNAAKMHARQTNAHPACSIDGELPDEDSSFIARTFVDARPNPEESCAQKERSGILTRALRDLPPMYRRAIELCDVEGLAGKDAAETLGISIPALKTCLHRARRLVFKKIHQRHASQGNCFLPEVQVDLRRASRPEFGRSERNRWRKNLQGERYEVHSGASTKPNVGGPGHGFKKRGKKQLSRNSSDIAGVFRSAVPDVSFTAGWRWTIKFVR